MRRSSRSLRSRDGGTEGRRDGGTEIWRDGGTEGRRDVFSGFPSVSLSLCPSVPLVLCLSISPSLLERITFDAHRRPVNALGADYDHVAGVVEGQSDERRAGERDFGVAPVGRDSDDAAAPPQ